MRPFMVEFTGTPESGKTTVIFALRENLQKLNYKVGYIQESAELKPKVIPKGTPSANLWMKFNTYKNIILSFYEDYDIVLIDRGVWDSLFFDEKIYLEGKSTLEQKKIYSEIIKDKTLLPNLLIAFFVTPYESIRRRGGEGKLVTIKSVTAYNKQLTDFYDKEVKGLKESINTTNKTKEEVQNIVKDIILNNYKIYKKNI